MSPCLVTYGPLSLPINNIILSFNRNIRLSNHEHTNQTIMRGSWLMAHGQGGLARPRDLGARRALGPGAGPAPLP